MALTFPLLKEVIENIKPLNGVPGISSVSIVLSPQVKPINDPRVFEGPSLISVEIVLSFVCLYRI